MKPLVTADTPPTDEVLNTIAHLPTKSLSKIVADGFFQKLTDKDFTRIAVLLALKSYEEGGCPIGGVFINNETRLIPGKGHSSQRSICFEKVRSWTEWTENQSYSCSRIRCKYLVWQRLLVMCGRLSLREHLLTEQVVIFSKFNYNIIRII
jgi:hypothetical protein